MRPGYASQKCRTMLGVSSVELLSTTNTSHETVSGRTHSVTLCKALVKLWLRLKVHKITVIFITVASGSHADVPLPRSVNIVLRPSGNQKGRPFHSQACSTLKSRSLS